ncbi:amino acid adenylation domain-containing protein [Actinokineospora guangxiensis]|uniref:Amino acid adenylation domain-containing protein n=1 Tax=Actinokineospora guangxiensis TaxID=1490288 RepID=A0ABW0EKI7_9PSEU
MDTYADTIAGHPPDAIALSTEDGDVTYGELSARIDSLARALAARGAGPEKVVAVAVDRGVDAVVAVAAITRAGAAFLTLDTSQPAARLAGLVRSGGASLLVTADGTTVDLPIAAPPVLVGDTGDWPGDFPSPRPDGLAYVSHTSGSTGEPSPVLIEHRGLDSYLRFIAADYGLGPHTVAVQMAPMGYDASIRDTFAPLLAGGRLVLLPRSALLRPAEFGAAVARHGVDTILSTTPSFLSFLAGQPDPAALLGGMRLVVSSGESLRPFLSAGGRALVPGELVNQYGPTEATMTSTRFRVPADPELEVDIVGEPVGGVVVRVLGEDLEPVADGDVGEVYIGGAGVARGYHGLAGRTAERFVPDPHGPPGARLYRTGDLARWGPGGLHFLGRGDRQVKIRGYRVDPAEVEGALLTHPGVLGAVVSAEHDDRGRVFLTAHVAGDCGGATDGALRAHLAASLPPHLMPRRFVRLAELPTTRSGKTDRRALSGSGGP